MGRIAAHATPCPIRDLWKRGVLPERTHSQCRVPAKRGPAPRTSGLLRPSTKRRGHPGPVEDPCDYSVAEDLKDHSTRSVLGDAGLKPALKIQGSHTLLGKWTGKRPKFLRFEKQHPANRPKAKIGGPQIRRS
ncbi:hypothetical protein L209DRAFT_757780 [Thermothelomyces heterothallicus CBS 203.75]